MTAGVNTATDFRALGELRAQAAQNSPEAAREAARQFEALFVQMMLKSMREANDTLSGKSEETTYRDMFDQQISLDMTKGRGLGLADMLVRQLAGQAQAAQATADGQPGGGLTANLSERIAAQLRRAPVTAGPAPVALSPGELAEPGLPEAPALAAPAFAQALSPAATGGRSDWRPASREEFLRDIWPLAVKAGRQLNVDPRAIVAQAALETGWGSRMARDDSGVSGNNPFNIKADAGWTGDRVTVTTLEYEGGLPKPQRAQFRAYPSLAEGFADYVQLLQSNPRYGDALRSGGNPGVYAERLQSAGYATDPRYAEKIRSILASPVMDQAVQALKGSAGVPIYTPVSGDQIG